MTPEQEHEWAIERHRCLVRWLLHATRERGIEWLESFVRGCKWWPTVRADFKQQRAAGSAGQPGEWR